MTYIGVDPGKSGAMAIIDGDTVKVIPFDERAYIDALLDCDILKTVACIEYVHSMPHDKPSAAFKFGENYGWTQGLCAAYGIPYQLVSPQKWKNEYGATKDKKTSIAICKRLFPRVSLRRTERSRMDDDGVAEAILMAEYARRKFGRGEE